MRMSRVMMVVALVTFAQAASANVYTYHPTPPDLSDLDHTKAYLWGIQPNVPTGQTIIGAGIVIHNIYDWTTEPNDLYITLINTAALGVTVVTDNSNDNVLANYYSASGTQLVDFHNVSTTPSDLSYALTAPQLATLISYIANNNIGLGFDPDCHYYNNGIDFTITTEPTGNSDPAVPEPAAGAILLAGLGMIIIRRKRG